MQKFFNMSPEEAYNNSIERGIKHINQLIDDATNFGYTSIKLSAPYWINPKVIEHFKKLGYEFSEYHDVMTWQNAKPAFNQ